MPPSCSVTRGGGDRVRLGAPQRWSWSLPLAAIGVPPFTDERKLVGVLTHIWLTSLYCPRPPQAGTSAN